ncbi:MAG: glycogen synthase [Christensenellaceae bacterium]
MAEKTTKKTVKTTEKKIEKTTEKTTDKKPVKKATKKTVKKTEVVKVEKKQKILFVASEANPFIGTGGLADVIGSLPVALAENDKLDISVALPLYGDMEQGYRSHLTFEGNFNVALGWRNQYCGLFSYKHKNVTFYFIDNEYYFKRNGIYGFFDDAERFAFFSKAVLDAMAFINNYPDIIHCHDWQTALTVIYLKTVYTKLVGYKDTRAIFTIHNIEYQGKYGKELLGDVFGLPDEVGSILDYDGCINLMKGAMTVADYVTTVSPSYANEIKHEFFAHGLQHAVNGISQKLVGILNGLDTKLYNSETNPSMFAKFNKDDFSGKKICKAELQKMLNLPVRDDVPVIAIVSRLVSHKGLDLVKHVFEALLTENVQVVILGKGEVYYESYFSYMAEKYSGKCRAIIAYNRDLSTKIYSGADMLLMPSKQEPCGLSQMIATRFATIPIVRKTGGLRDSITPFNDKNRNGGIGFVFENYNADEMLYVIKDAIYVYGDKKIWNGLMYRAITADFSWKKSAQEYVKLYDLYR